MGFFWAAWGDAGFLALFVRGSFLPLFVGVLSRGYLRAEEGKGIFG